MADVVDNTAAPAPQVAGGGGKPPGKRGNRGCRNPPPDRQQKRAGKGKRQEKSCPACGATDHDEEEHFEWTMMNSINPLAGARRDRLQARRAASSSVSDNHQEGGQRRKTRRGRRPSLQERRRRRAAQQQPHPSREVEQPMALALQPHPHREVEQHSAVTLQALQQPHPHAQHQGCERPQVLPQRADEPLLSTPMEDEPSDTKDLLVFSDSADSDL
ncbi:hypothetical protein BDV41DRAFT_579337 [Aspergillus transmontanensis]|uniref:Uncharacterized protein n=1 Tax=Aspergillus transmontanensis TaxID=1034304 RepID=A0A5N6VQ74_9EURO|nr:hypothetical protein BDV41DRAFT_579337 [Aspergillus transmontanensis]